MTQTASPIAPMTLGLRMGSRLRLSDDELFELCAGNPDLQIERTAEGDLLVMTPAGGESSYRNAEIVSALRNWAIEDGTGVVFDSSAGFLLPNGAMRSPDASWLVRRRLEGLSSEEKRRFLPLCPDFVVELRSPSDPLDRLQEKMAEYRDNGARLGWLLDPEDRRVWVYRPGRPVETLEDAASLAGAPELPGFVFDLDSIWRPL